MGTPDEAAVVDELSASFETAGELMRWVDRRLDGTTGQSVLNEAYREVTRRLLNDDGRDAAHWEQLLFASAVRSSKTPAQPGLDACKAAIGQLTEKIESGGLSGMPEPQVVTLASGLTLALTAQKRLRQPIETAIGALADRFENLLSNMAERCQDIWQRRGQMSGAESLFVWDVRHSVWRLNQDFKTYRPED